MKKRLLVGLLVLGLCGVLASAAYSADTTVKYAHWNALSEEYNYVKAFEEKYPDIKIELR